MNPDALRILRPGLPPGVSIFRRSSPDGPGVSIYGGPGQPPVHAAAAAKERGLRRRAAASLAVVHLLSEMFPEALHRAPSSPDEGS